MPIPGSPISSTRLPKPIRTGAIAAERIVSSRSRPTNGSRRSGSAAAVPETATTSKAATGSAMPLSVSGSSSTVSNVLRERSSRSDVGQHLAGLGLAHQPRGERCRLAEDRVGAPEASADLAGEDAAARGADPQRQLAS